MILRLAGRECIYPSYAILIVYTMLVFKCGALSIVATRCMLQYLYSLLQTHISTEARSSLAVCHSLFEGFLLFTIPLQLHNCTSSGRSFLASIFAWLLHRNLFLVSKVSIGKPENKRNRSGRKYLLLQPLTTSSEQTRYDICKYAIALPPL